MIKKLVYRLETINPWHFIWVSIVFSELLTAGFSALQSYLWWGKLSRELMLGGVVDALLVPLLVAPAVIYIVRNSARLQKLNDRLASEIDVRKQAVNALVASEARYRAIIDAFDGLIYICSPDNRIEFMNERMKERIGGDTAGDLCFKVLHGRDSACPQCINDKIFSGETIRWEMQSPRDNRWYYVTTTAIRNADRTVSKQAMIMDINDRRNMEEDLLKAKKLESIGLLAGGIAHDFNNLLVGMLSNIELAKMKVITNSSAYGRLTEAEQAAYRAKDLTRQLLTFAKGGAPLKTTLALGNIVMKSAMLSLRGSNVKPDFRIPHDLWPVEADDGQLSQVINNVVMNAEQAMPDGGTITIVCENVVLGSSKVTSLTAGKYVKVMIEDHGIGIAKEHLSRIFDPYFTTKQKGSGLGLATAYSIVKKHRGMIIVESELGKGSRLQIYLPASEKKVRPQSFPDDVLTRGHGRILIMDDDEIVRESSRSILEELGYEVALACDGTEALYVYQKAKETGKPFDAVIMDLTVPGGLGGKETIRRMLRIDPGAKVIVSSGYSSDPVLAEYRDHGFKGVVTKPYRIKDLSETVYSVIHSA
jgi:signal transduction histidine kinase/CheY-like chemotaxis protein